MWGNQGTAGLSNSPRSQSWNVAEEDLDTGRLAEAGKADTQNHANSREARTGPGSEIWAKFSLFFRSFAVCI